jgi:hypothetical protein
MPTTITPAPTRARRRLVGFLLLTAALAATGCGDTAAPTGPDAGEVAAGDAPTGARRARNPYISSLAISSNAVFFATDSGSIVFDIVLQNPGPKTGELYLAGMILQGSLGADSPAMIVKCSERDGLMPRGTCTMRVEMWVAPGAFTDGPARFRLKLFRWRDNDSVVLDERNVDVSVVRL